MSQIPLRFLDLIPRDYFHQGDINVINRKSRGYDDLIGIKGCIISRGFDRHHGFVKGKRVFWQFLTDLASIHSYHFILKILLLFHLICFACMIRWRAWVHQRCMGITVWNHLMDRYATRRCFDDLMMALAYVDIAWMVLIISITWSLSYRLFFTRISYIFLFLFFIGDFNWDIKSWENMCYDCDL